MKLEVTSICAVLIWFMMPLWRSRFSFMMGICCLAKSMSSCKLWFKASVCDSFSCDRSSFSLSCFSCHLRSVMSLMHASCSKVHTSVELQTEYELEIKAIIPLSLPPLHLSLWVLFIDCVVKCVFTESGEWWISSARRSTNHWLSGASGFYRY